MSLYKITAYKITAFTLKYDGPVRNLCLITSGSLRYEERVVHNPTCKFAYEESQVGFGQGVHLRCLHNNKYLVRQAGTDWITATANEPVEDTNRRDCTLFRINIVSNNSMRWVHVNTNIFVAIAAPNDSLYSYYLTIRPNNTNQVETIPIDVERIIKLPKTVVFKGDNGKYLSVQNSIYQPFVGNDRHRKETWFETFPVSNGDVRFRSVQNNNFMRRDNNGWVVADSTDTTSNNANTVFQIARLSDTTIALINRGNNRFCQRFGNDDRFKAEIDSGVKEAELTVEEPIVDRTIDIEYRFKDARVYDEKPRSWLSQVAFNDAKDRDLETQLTITYTESHTFSFHVTTAVRTNFLMRTSAAAGVPLIAKVKTEFEFSVGFDVEVGFEKTEENSESYEFKCTVIIPPGEKRRAKVMALEARCDVPFDYIQTEVQANGEIIRTKLEDGVYRGMNGYEFHVQVYDPDEPSTLLHDDPIATHYLPDTFAREKVYLKNNRRKAIAC
ncbi:hypothetical protein RND81_14G220000 [Saponaria officinalis]|uniref:Agglutinin domain-containing protein n=1 Tax=Saponaria officinalis TaxID=3572 RepID=A0AAW1GV10_SAPOF